MFHIVSAVGTVVMSVCAVIALLVMFKVYLDGDMDEDYCCDCCKCCHREEKK